MQTRQTHLIHGERQNKGEKPADRLKKSVELRNKKRQDKKKDRNEFYRDSVLAQMTLQLAKLHRAVLKNHHHLLILIGNFGGNAKNVREHKGNNETGNVKD